MCFIAPKKVVLRKGDFFVVEGPGGTRQKVKSMIKIKVGDYCITQQGIIVEKVSRKSAEIVLSTLKNYHKGKRDGI